MFGRQGGAAAGIGILAEINDSQREAWLRVIEAFDEGTQQTTQLALFPADRATPDHARGYGVQVRLDRMQLHRPRQWAPVGWLACCMSNSGLMSSGRAGCPIRARARVGAIFFRRWSGRLIDPGSEWRLHRLWFEQSAMGIFSAPTLRWSRRTRSIAAWIRSCRSRRSCSITCGRRWQDLFGARFDVLLYDLTST